MSSAPLWTVDAMAQGHGRARAAARCRLAISGISIDSRSIGRGEAFFAIKGDARDGHDFVPAALANGAGLAVVAADKRDAFAKDAPLLVVPDVLEGLRALARASRARSEAKVIGVTGSVGKTGTKEALRLALTPSGETHASVASYNNHWGVPLSLARCPASARFAVFEMGMNHAGEIEPLSQLVQPHIAIVTTIAPVHLEYLGSIEAIADAKAEIFRGLVQGGAAVINRDIPQYQRLARAAEAAGARVVSFGEHAKADARLIKSSLQADCSTVQARILGADVTYKLGAPGRHVVIEFAGGAGRGLARRRRPGAGGTGARRACAADRPRRAQRARASRRPRAADRRELQRQSGLHAGGDRAARAGRRRRRRAAASPCSATCWSSGRAAPSCIAALVEPVVAQGIDLVFCCGPLMHSLWEALPSERRGAYAETSAALEPQVLAAIRAGDAIMIKGSLGSRMGPIVKALEQSYSRNALAAPSQG